jgi:transcriptional regulator with XRE-family HTH domain
VFISTNSTSLISKLHDREYRESFVSSLINSTIAYQIRYLRKNENLDQAELGVLAGMKQAAISRLENPDYGNLSVNTLKRIAKALDVGLIVRFAPFSEVARWRLLMSPQDMAPPAFSKDRALESTAAIFAGSTHTRSETRSSHTGNRQIADSSTARQLELQFDAPVRQVILVTWGQSTAYAAKAA